MQHSRDFQFHQAIFFFKIFEFDLVISEINKRKSEASKPKVGTRIQDNCNI